VSKNLKDNLIIAGIVILLVGGAAFSWVVLGSIPPNCHKKLDPGFCITRKEKTFKDRPGARLTAPFTPVLVSTTPR
jgi:hypothetical protein